MKAAGIIAEYDPFHMGHLYNMDKARELTGAEAIVTVISGHFVQRGKPAFFPRNLRARMALEAGADLVLELPFIYSCSSSRDFAAGAAGILNGLGCIDYLVFGAEEDRMDLLTEAAEASEDADRPESRTASIIKSCLDEGLSYPQALSRSIEEVFGKETSALLSAPNNLLATEYIKALKKLHSYIKPLAVRRAGAGHDDMSEEISPKQASEALKAGRAVIGTENEMLYHNKHMVSGSFIRNKILNAEMSDVSAFLPDSSLKALAAFYDELHDESSRAHGNPVLSSVLEETLAEKASGVLKLLGKAHNASSRTVLQLLKYRILTSSAGELAGIYGVDEGIENRLVQAAGKAGSMDELIHMIKSRRYTYARLSRMLMYVLMNVKEEEVRNIRGCCHARVLGFSEKGRQLLKQIRKSSSIPVISNLAGLDRMDASTGKILDIDIKAGSLYRMLLPDISPYSGERAYRPYICGGF